MSNPDLSFVNEYLVYPAVAKVFEALWSASASVAFVGGCVRDGLLGLEPNDIDLAVTLNPNAIRVALESKSIKVIPTGLKHHTVTALVDDMPPIEITSVRKNMNDNWCWESDLRSRDFTINAMAAGKADTGKPWLFDPFGGYDDLMRGVVRFTDSGSARILEDPLRILRYYRFRALFNKCSDTKEKKFCYNYRMLLNEVSGERIWDEVKKLMSFDRIHKIIIPMTDSDYPIFDTLIPGATTMFRLPLVRMAKMERKLGLQPCPLRRLAVLFQHVQNNETTVDDLANRWKMSNYERNHLAFLVDRPHDLVGNMSQKLLRYWLYHLGEVRFRDLAFVNMVSHATSQDKFEAIMEVINLWEKPKLPITGRDVRERGVKEGMLVGMYLADVEDWWAEMDFQPGRAECLDKLEDVLTAP